MPLKEMITLATTVEGGQVVVSPVPTVVVNLKGEDSDAAAYPTSTNSLKQTNPTINAGENSPKTSTRLTNAAEIPSRPGIKADSSRMTLSPTRAASSTWLPHPFLRPSHRGVPHVSPALR